MLQTIVLFCHLAVALLIIGLVLLQRGKGADAGTGFGAGASGTVFGARGTASFFSRATAVLATVFFVTSLALAWLAGQTTEPTSILDSLEEPTGIGIERPIATGIDESGLPDVPALAPVGGSPAESVDESGSVEVDAAADELPAVPDSDGNAND